MICDISYVFIKAQANMEAPMITIQTGIAATESCLQAME